MESSEAKQLVAKAKEFYWPAFARDASWFDNPMSILESGDGDYVVDIFGNRLLDATSSGAATHLGFNVPEVMEAVLNQMKKIANTTPSFFAPTEPCILLAEKIASISPGSLKYTIFGSNGSDANEAAVKIARQYWKIMGKGTKYKVLHRYPGDYHGMGLAMSSASGHRFRRVAFEPLMGGFIAIHAPNCYRCPYGLSYPECNLLCAEELRKVVDWEEPSTIACFMVETTNTGLGIIPSPPGYMKTIRDICDKYEILLIVDEVITGFGKSGFWFESEKHEIVPDMITMGKGICAGCGPLAGTHVKPEIAEVFTGKNVIQHGYTFGGMGYLAAAGLAGINYVEKYDLLARVREMSARLLEELGPLKDKSPIVGDVRVNGIMASVEIVKDKTKKEVFPDNVKIANVVSQVGRDNGVLLPCSTWYGDNINLYLHLNMPDEGVDLIINTVKKAVAEVEKQVA